MTLILFVGGPEHGRTRHIPQESLTSTYMVLPRGEFTAAGLVDEVISAQVQLIAYQLGKYAAQGLTWYYYATKDAEFYGQGCPDSKREQVTRADWLLEIRHPEIIPICVVPGCSAYAPRVYTSQIEGRLAGRRWYPGDRIRMCPKHGNDLMNAQSAVGVDNLPEWLRPDANLFGLDSYDAATDLVNGSTIAYGRARALLVQQEEPGS